MTQKTIQMNDIQKMNFFHSSIIRNDDDEDSVKIDENTQTFQLFHAPDPMFYDSNLRRKQTHRWLRIGLPKNEDIAICVPELEELYGQILERCPKLR